MSRISLRFLVVVALLVPLLASAQTGAKIDVNLASLTDLQKLPGITPELAQKILRRNHTPNLQTCTERDCQSP